jgi:hypothetical protein
VKFAAVHTRTAEFSCFPSQFKRRQSKSILLNAIGVINDSGTFAKQRRKLIRNELQQQKTQKLLSH